jgi:ribosome-associated heat shock protein Hsp15
LDRQRIDKWLWHARVVRTRSAAAALAASGHVRINGQRIDGASRPVRLGDVVTVALDRTVRVLKVAAFAERRGPAESVHVLVEDLTPAPAPGPASSANGPAGARQPGTGRPTKRDRRAIAHMRGEDEF